MTTSVRRRCCAEMAFTFSPRPTFPADFPAMKRLILLSVAILATVQFATAGVIITEEAEQSGGAMPGKTQLTNTV